MKKYIFLILLFSAFFVACGKKEAEIEITTILPTQPPVELVVVTPTPLPSASPTPTLIPSPTNFTKEECLSVLEAAFLQQKQIWNNTRTADAKTNMLLDIDIPDAKASLKIEGTAQIGKTSAAILTNVTGTIPGDSLSKRTEFYGEINEAEQTYTTYTKEDGKWSANIYRLEKGDTLFSLLSEQEVFSFSSDGSFFGPELFGEELDPSSINVFFKDNSTLRIETPSEAIEEKLNSLFTVSTPDIQTESLLPYTEKGLLTQEELEDTQTPEPLFQIPEGTSDIYTEITLDLEDMNAIRIKRIAIGIQLPFVFQKEEYGVSLSASITVNTIGEDVYVEKPLGIETATVSDWRNYSLGYEFSDTFENVIYHDNATPAYRNKEIKKAPADDPTKLEFSLQGETHAIRQSLQHFIPDGYSIARIQDDERDYTLKLNERLPETLTPYSVYLQGENLPAIVVQIQSTKKDMTLQNSEVIGVAYAGEDFILPKGLDSQSTYQDAFWALERPSTTVKDEQDLYAYWYYGEYTLLLKFTDEKLISFSIKKES